MKREEKLDEKRRRGVGSAPPAPQKREKLWPKGLWKRAFFSMKFFASLFSGKTELSEMDENELARSAQNGNREAFDLLCEKTLPKVFSYFARRVDDEKDREDLTSETMWKVLDSLKKWSGDENFSAWVFAIAKYTFYDFLREKYKNPEITFSEMGESAENLPAIEALEEDEKMVAQKIELLDTVLSILPEKHQMVLHLRFLRGYTLEETAEELGLSLANVKVIQHRALKKIRDENPHFEYSLEKV